MRKIVFYISGLGFGHLTRSMAVIQELVCHRDVHVTVKCYPPHMPLVLSTFPCDAVEVLPFDLGFQICFDDKTGKVDFAATLHSVTIWLDRLEAGAEAEAARCLGKGYSLVLSDIAPEAFFVAGELGAPSIGISNYTWYEFLKEFVDDSKLAGIKAMYKQATYFLEYPLSTGDEIPVTNKKPVGLVSRPQDKIRISYLRQKYKRPGRLLLFLSVGGALSLHNVKLSPDIDYLYTRGIDLAGAENATPVPVDTVDTQNYLAACDGVITKCGWSTVAEALIAQRPLFLLQTGEGGKEERYMLQELKGLGVSQVVESAEQLYLATELFNHINELKEAYVNIPSRYTDGIREIAEIALDKCK